MIVSANSLVQHVIQKWNNKTCQCEFKNYRKFKKDYSWNPRTCICEHSRYLKSIGDISVITCDEIISVTDIASTKMTNTITTNMSTNSYDKKSKILLYIAHSFLSDHITVDNYYFFLSLCISKVKTKKHWCTKNIKRKISNFKKFVIKIVCVIISVI